ncbi:MAG: ABC transporter permease subunit [Gammaproteobacteria bacterium]
MAEIKRHRQRSLVPLLLLPSLVLLLAVFVVPLGQILLLSFEQPAWTLEHYTTVFEDDVLVAVLLRTLALSVKVTALCLFLGYPIAYAMLRSSNTMRGIIALLVILPLWTSLLVRTYAWIVILGRKGMVNEALIGLGIIDMPIALLYNRFSVYVGMVHIMLPFMVLPLYAVMQRIDLRLMSAAWSLGAGRAKSFVLIFLPLSLPGVLAGSLLVFILSIGFFVTPALLGGLGDTTFVMLIERQINRLFDWPLASAMSIILLIATLALVIVYRRLLSTGPGGSALVGRGLVWLMRIASSLSRALERRPRAVTGNPSAQYARRPGWRPSIALIAAWLIVFAMDFPLSIVFPLSFSDAPFLQFPPPDYSLRWFEKYFSREDWTRPTITSFQVAGVTMVAATIIGTLAAIAIVRSDFPGKALAVGLLLSPIIVPTIILAVALYYLFAKYGLIGTRTGLILAHTVLAVPYVIVVVSAALERVDHSLEQAAWTLGATKPKAFVKVTLPLIRPAVLIASLFAFLASFDEVVIAIFISGTSATTLPKRMWDGIREEIDPTTAAVAALLIALSLGLMLVVEVLRRRAAVPSDASAGGILR